MATFDHERVLQVLANLLTNAIKFTRAGGRISLRVEPVGQDVRFSVADTGSGIPGHQQAHGGRIWVHASGGFFLIDLIVVWTGCEQAAEAPPCVGVEDGQSV